MCVCVRMYISVYGEANQPNSYSLTNSLLEYSLLYFDKCYSSVRNESNQKSTLHKPTDFFFPLLENASKMARTFGNRMSR